MNNIYNPIYNSGNFGKITAKKTETKNIKVK